MSNFSIDECTEQYDYTWLQSNKCEIVQGVIYAPEESACTITVTSGTRTYHVKYPDGRYMSVYSKGVECYQLLESPNNYSKWVFTPSGGGFAVNNSISGRHPGG